MTPESSMPPPPGDGVFARAQAGDEDAWREIFEECYPKIIRAIRRRFHSGSAIRSMYDSCDFAGDVWKSLAAKSSNFQFATIDDVTAFLIHAAQDRLNDTLRKHLSQKRDVRRLEKSGGDAPSPLDFCPQDRQETPSTNARLDEARDWIYRSTRNDQERRVLEMRDAHLGNDVIASRLGLTIRQVQRILADVRERLERREGRGD